MRLILFASDLPSKVADYEFTKLRNDERILLKNSDLASKEIKSKGKFMDYYAAVDFDGLVMFRKKTGLHSFFRMTVKDGKRTYSEIEGFIRPAHPELLLLSEDTVVYSFSSKDLAKKETSWNFDVKYLPNYTSEEELGSGYKFYEAVMTPITKQGVGVVMTNVPDELNKEIVRLFNENKDSNIGIKVTHLTNSKSYKSTVAIIDLETQKIIDGVVLKGGSIDTDLSIDLHNHTLPGVDDGSESNETTIELIDELKEMGVDEIILTPHNNEDFNNIGYAEKKHEELKSTYSDKGVSTHLSSEHKATESFVNKSHINQSIKTHPFGFILLEFDMDNDDRDYIMKTAVRMSIIYGKIIIAHAERYKSLSAHSIKLLSSMGCLIQTNYKSIDPEQDDEVINLTEDLIEDNLIDLLATDTHRQDHIDQTLRSMDKFKSVNIFNNLFKK